MSFAYSHNETDFHGEFDSMEEALAEARSSECSGCWIGVIKTADDYLPQYATSLGESAIEQADQWLSENDIPAEDTIFDPTPEQKNALGNLIVKWIQDHLTGTSWAVEEVKRHEFEPEAQAKT